LACHQQIDVDPDPDPTFHFDADPDPANHFDADPDSDHNLMQIRIHNTDFHMFFAVFLLQHAALRPSH
jgi:hypothetical protein